MNKSQILRPGRILEILAAATLAVIVGSVFVPVTVTAR